MTNGSIAIIGAGIVGRGWSISFARAGYEVRLFDSIGQALDSALQEISGLVDDLSGHDLLNGQSPSEILERIRPADSLERALNGAFYVQECTPELLDSKRKVFVELDGAAGPDAILASSTSALLPSLFTSGLQGRRRCLVAHPINPPYLVPAVELVPAPWTDAEVIARASAVMRRCRQAPIVVRQECEGFIVNCLQGALLQEACRLVLEGYASANDIDIAVRDGLGLRWSFMGPFETIDLNAPGGIRDYVSRYGRAYERIADTQHPVSWDSALADMLEHERAQILPRSGLAERCRWRDRRLMSLMAHRQTEAGE